MKDGRTIKMGWKHFERLECVQIRSDKRAGTMTYLFPKDLLNHTYLQKQNPCFFKTDYPPKSTKVIKNSTWLTFDPNS